MENILKTVDTQQFIFGIYIKNIMFYAISAILGLKCTDIQIIWNFPTKIWQKLEKKNNFKKPSMSRHKEMSNAQFGQVASKKL